jgi:hypothetical protein
LFISLGTDNPLLLRCLKKETYKQPASLPALQGAQGGRYKIMKFSKESDALLAKNPQVPRIFHAFVGTAVGAGGNPDLHAGVSRARRPGDRPGLGTTVQGAAFAAAREPRTSFAAAGGGQQVL